MLGVLEARQKRRVVLDFGRENLRQARLYLNTVLTGNQGNMQADETAQLA
jgi:hypothetical protein